MGKTFILMIITTIILTLILTGEYNYIMRKGFPLSLKMQEIASEIGIKNPENVRILLKNKIFGMSHIGGMTIGNAILVKNGCYYEQLVTHELIHVRQYQDAGGIGKFLYKYMKEVLRHGYWNAPTEVEARDKSDKLTVMYNLSQEEI